VVERVYITIEVAILLEEQPDWECSDIDYEDNDDSLLNLENQNPLIPLLCDYSPTTI
jgi:hypothetical protein